MDVCTRKISIFEHLFTVRTMRTRTKYNNLTVVNDRARAENSIFDHYVPCARARRITISGALATVRAHGE